MLRNEGCDSGLGSLCGLFGFTRQAYNKRKDTDGFAEEAIEPIIIEKAREYRKSNPGLGAAKLHAILKKKFGDTGCFPGRDAFIELLRKYGLMVRMKRRKRYKTTDSEHNYRKYPNLIKGLVPNRPNQIWASDITYVETNEGGCYLSLITDLYSHKIVGWAVGPTLETTYPLQALNMALEDIDDNTAKGLIHHSDRGCQYCSQVYVSMLKKRGTSISMTQSGDPLENAVAERANGILKTEWLYRMEIPTRKSCETELKRIIAFYNEERPHMSIGYQTPAVVHQQSGSQQKMWKNPWQQAHN